MLLFYFRFVSFRVLKSYSLVEVFTSLPKQESSDSQNHGRLDIGELAPKELHRLSIDKEQLLDCAQDVWYVMI